MFRTLSGVNYFTETLWQCYEMRITLQHRQKVKIHYLFLHCNLSQCSLGILEFFSHSDLPNTIHNDTATVRASVSISTGGNLFQTFLKQALSSSFIREKKLTCHRVKQAEAHKQAPYYQLPCCQTLFKSTKLWERHLICMDKFEGNVYSVGQKTLKWLCCNKKHGFVYFYVRFFRWNKKRNCMLTFCWDASGDSPQQCPSCTGTLCSSWSTSSLLTLPAAETLAVSLSELFVRFGGWCFIYHSLYDHWCIENGWLNNLCCHLPFLLQNIACFVRNYCF